MSSTTSEKSDLELQLLKKQVDKLTLEVAALDSSGRWDWLIGRCLPLATALLAVAGFWVGIIQYYMGKSETDQQRVVAVQSEAAKPFWDTQLQLYIMASKAAATIATSTDETALSAAEVEFWSLYWGPLSCVEDIGLKVKQRAEVEAAMVEFGAYLAKHPQDDRSSEYLKSLSLALAHAMRDEIGPSFSLMPTPLNKRHPE